jgi:hypothetical protein
MRVAKISALVLCISPYLFLIPEQLSAFASARSPMSTVTKLFTINN